MGPHYLIIVILLEILLSLMSTDHQPSQTNTSYPKLIENLQQIRRGFVAEVIFSINHPLFDQITLIYGEQFLNNVFIKGNYILYILYTLLWRIYLFEIFRYSNGLIGISNKRSLYLKHFIIEQFSSWILCLNIYIQLLEIFIFIRTPYILQ